MLKLLCLFGLGVSLLGLAAPFFSDDDSSLLVILHFVGLLIISGISFLLYQQYKTTNTTITDLSVKLAAVQDIKEESQKNFSSLLENIPCFISVISPQYDCLMVNGYITKVTGIPKEALLREKCFKNLGCGDTICPDCPTKNAFITKKVCREIKISRINENNDVLIEITAIPVLNKAGTAVKYVIEIAQDITEKHLGEETKAKLLHQTITALSKLIEKRDEATNAHCISVEKLAMAIGKNMDLPKEMLDDLSIAATLHDIGKLGIPEVILNKPDTLSAEEYSLVKTHPLIGYETLISIAPFKHIAESILYHHEKFDGTGYPEQLTGEQIPITSRIIAVADVWEALITDRPYRKAYPKNEALQIMLKQNHSHFDPTVFQHFVKVVSNNDERLYNLLQTPS
ncbi:MAG: domain S-box-containing protein [Firmicutes bacterium]|nr:domain S-box-containing protein [Bacillota bacterium]